MPRGVVALVLSTTIACSTPVAVGSIAVGGGTLIGAKVMYKEDCDGEGCVYGNLLAALLGTVGLVLVTVGGVSLAIDQNGTE